MHQKFITLLDFGSCRFYPTCSTYAKINIKYNNIFMSLFFITKRLLTCNQYFIGGVDYPTVRIKDLDKRHTFILSKSFYQFNKNKITYWLVYLDCKKKYVYWIENFKN